MVIDSISGRKGILDSNGREKIPTVYDHLIIKDKIIYCGFGGYDDDDSNFFSGCIKHACWGVVTKEGVPIIEPSLYNCFKEKDGYIFPKRFTKKQLEIADERGFFPRPNACASMFFEFIVLVKRLY